MMEYKEISPILPTNYWYINVTPGDQLRFPIVGVSVL